MRAGKGAAALLLVIALISASRLEAADRRGVVGELSGRVKNLLPSILIPGPDVAPQAVAVADPQGPTVNPAKLDQPAALERQLRTALRRPIDETRLTVVGGTARLGHYSVGSAENIHGHVVVLEGDVDVHGRVEGNIVALDGDIIVHPGGSVVGDVLAIGGHVREVGGNITGAQQSLEAVPITTPADTPSIASVIARRAAGFVGVFLVLLTLGFGLVTFGRPNLEIVSDTVMHSFGRAFVVGLLGEVLILPTFGMLVVGLVLTVAGALLVPFGIVVYTLLAIVSVLGGVLAVAHAMGETITRRRMAAGLRVSPNAYRYLLTGLMALGVSWLAWVLFGWVPIAGGLILSAAAIGTWFVGTVGFGAALLSRGGIREHFAGRIVPPEMLTDEYLWATPQFGVPAVKRPSTEPEA
ncbi:MAG: polymer-forming cytoskeletal protein [Gemmatimonadota bacterium]